MERFGSAQRLLERHPVLGGFGLSFIGILATGLATYEASGRPAISVFLLLFWVVGGVALAPTYIFLMWFPSGIRCFRRRLAKALDTEETKFEVPIPTGMRALRNWFTLLVLVLYVVVLAPVYHNTDSSSISGEVYSGSWWIFWSYALLFGLALSINVANVRDAGRWIIAGVRTERLQIKPFHPDGAGGYSFLGDLFIIFLLYAVFLGLLFGADFLFLLMKDVPVLDVDELILLWSAIAILYVGLVYVFIIQPLLVIQVEMRRLRDLILMEIADEMQRCQSDLRSLMQTESGLSFEQTKQAHEELLNLNGMYQVIQGTFSTLPFSIIWRRSIPVAAILPLVVGTLPLINELMGK